MPEKLIAIQEVSILLGISEQEIKKLVERGDLPAYRIGGEFLRFRKEQIEAIRDGVPGHVAIPTPKAIPKKLPVKKQDLAYSQSRLDRILDFFYFNDFYIASLVVIFLILWVIFKT